MNAVEDLPTRFTSLPLSHLVLTEKTYRDTCIKFQMEGVWYERPKAIGFDMIHRFVQHYLSLYKSGGACRMIVCMRGSLLKELARRVLSRTPWDDAFASSVVIVCCFGDEHVFSDALHGHDVDQLARFVHAFFSLNMEESQRIPALRSKTHFLPIGVCRENIFWTERYRPPRALARDPLLLVNFTTSYSFPTHAAQHRKRALASLVRNGFARSPFIEPSELFIVMSEYACCACPRGIGADTYRYWEALAAGCAIVLDDWSFLRCAMPGRLPAVWVGPAAGCPVGDHVHMDAMGDVFVPCWQRVTRAALLRALRFMGWRRSSAFVREHVLRASQWQSAILRSATR